MVIDFLCVSSFNPNSACPSADMVISEARPWLLQSRQQLWISQHLAAQATEATTHHCTSTHEAAERVSRGGNGSGEGSMRCSTLACERIFLSGI